jgi:hypothetical protein
LIAAAFAAPDLVLTACDCRGRNPKYRRRYKMIDAYPRRFDSEMEVLQVIPAQPGTRILRARHPYALGRDHLLEGDRLEHVTEERPVFALALVERWKRLRGAKDNLRRRIEPVIPNGKLRRRLGPVPEEHFLTLLLPREQPENPARLLAQVEEAWARMREAELYDPARLPEGSASA